MIATQLPALQIVIPLLAAPLIVLARRSEMAWVIAVIANILCVLVAWQLFGLVSEQGIIRYSLGGWAAPTGIEYFVDTINAPLLLLISSVSAIVVVYAYHSVKKSVDSTKHYLFYAAWMLCLSGLLGMLITGDAFNVFVFLEISSLSTYMLIAFGNDRRALTASFRYLVLGSIGASFILIGIGFLYAATGSLNMLDLSQRIPNAASERAVLVAFSFISIGLMIKSAIFPLHAWLANAYHFAPISVTAFLAGTATKVSLYVLLRFLFSVFGTQYNFEYLLFNVILLPAAIFGFLIMSVVAVFQTDLRRMLAYSSVAQIGYIVAGISLATQAGITAGYAHIINHALIKSALFMSVGCIIYRLGHAHRPSLDNLIKTMPLTCAAFIISGLSLIGVPLTGGFVSKFTLISASMEKGWWIMGGLVLVSSVLAIIYIGRVVDVMLFRKQRLPNPIPQGRNEAPLSMLVPMYVLIGLSLYLGVFGSKTLGVASEAATQLLGGFR
ncbi:MAG: monovalent cation/H+ antiporter subunit D family protein [Granulosicoccaceae bacterium]